MSTEEAAPAGLTDAIDIWWRHAVVYQIYIRSFADGDGDGTGDLAGMRSRLAYLERLGVDAIWVNPWYESPLNDGGYDVADYRAIDTRYGTTVEAEAFIAEARERGIRVLVDLVPNHSSSQHRWFQEALAAPPSSPARNRYHFRAGRGPTGDLAPTDWPSVFGGPAWTRVPDGEWYLHLFDSTQPDFNWDNPEVQDEFDDILRFWLDRGAAGFRVDVAHALTKDPDFPDLAGLESRDGARWVEGHPFWDRDEVHSIIRRWRRILDEYDERMMVAEAWVRADRRPLYLRPDEYHQVFDFDLLRARWDANEFESVIRRAIEAADSDGSSPTWVLSNHDVVRHPTRYGLPADIDPEIWLLDGPHDVLHEIVGHRRARAAALIALALPGSHYVYQGDELGLPEVWDLPADVLDDPVWENSGHRRKGRDGCRVPIPWEAHGRSLGFGTGESWLPQPPSFAALSAAAQDDDPDSMLHLYRTALALRRERLIADQRITILDGGNGVLSFDRGGGVRCIANMGPHPIPMSAGEVLLASAAITDDTLPADTTVWLANAAGPLR